MSSRTATPRVLVVAAVIALHAGVLLALLAETRARLVRATAEARPLLVWFFEPLERPRPPSSAPASSRKPRTGVTEPQRQESEVPSPAELPAPAAIDWVAEAAQSASSQAEAAELRKRQARALAPEPSPMFAARPKHHEFAWDYARTHQVEPLGGLATAIRLNDQCVVVLFLIIPFAGGCALEKPQARGDLFDHMHDPQP